MEKEFVPYEIALALKELGFDEPCFGRYNVPGDFILLGCYSNSPLVSILVEQNDICEAHTLAPTFSQAFRWLLKHHNLHGVIIPTVTMYWTFKTMTVVESIVEVPPYKHVDANDYRTPEEAELACLKRLIEIVKEK